MMICTDPACPIRGLTAATCTRCGHGFTSNMPGYKEPIRYDAPAPAAEPPPDVAKKLAAHIRYWWGSPNFDLEATLAAALAAMAKERDRAQELAHALQIEQDAAIARAEQAERERLSRDQILAIRDEHLPSQGEYFDGTAFSNALIAAIDAARKGTT